MTGNNVIPFALYLERKREREERRIALFGDEAEHYNGGGLDELWAGPNALGSGGRVVALR